MPPPGAMAAAAALLPSSSSSQLLRLPRRFLSLTATPYPLYYDLIVHRPADPKPPKSSSDAGADRQPQPPPDEQPLDRAKRRYLRKRRSRLLPDPDAAAKPSASSSSEFVELRPEVVDFPRLHAREEALYFHDTFAMPWEKDKHYRMLYRLEKKYFPHQSLDNAFVPADAGPATDADRSLVFFDDEKKEDDGEDRVANNKDGDSDKGEVLERKVEDFFRSLRKPPGEASTKAKRPAAVGAEPRQVKREVPREEERPQPYLVTRTTDLPPRWDGPTGTVVLIDKPKGWTSFTVCGKLRRLVKVQKVGHAGTLDPMATGVLIVCIGKATKIVDSYQGMVKGYSGVFRLGEATSTWDADSPVIQREPWQHIKDEDIRKAAASFKGEIWQVPPMFSAIKVGGEKMYDKARRGETVELSPRRISIYQFDIERSLEDRQNLIFRVTCSKGTYIRSLCADLGKALGSCAHLTALRRDSIGEYSVNDAWNFDELEEQITKAYL
ncbi:tRNA pseudouridine synthase B-like [Panicum virgatum]|nr:tRNA pseudouridine synthase B-like [Panicum virgatum]